MTTQSPITDESLLPTLSGRGGRWIITVQLPGRACRWESGDCPTSLPEPYRAALAELSPAPLVAEVESLKRDLRRAIAIGGAGWLGGTIEAERILYESADEAEAFTKAFAFARQKQDETIQAIAKTQRDRIAELAERIAALTAPPSEEEIEEAMRCVPARAILGAERHSAAEAVLNRFLSNRTKGGEADTGHAQVPRQHIAQPPVEDAGGDGRKERLLEERNRLDNSFGRGLFRDGLTRDRIAEIDAELSPPSPVAGGGEKVLPEDVAGQMRRMGRVDWGHTGAKTDAEHLSDFADTLRLTREHFGIGDESLDLHGLYLAGTGTVLCHTGTSPNSAANARVLAGLWNSILDGAAIPSPPVAMPEWAELTEEQRDEIIFAVEDHDCGSGTVADMYARFVRALTPAGVE